jgi:heme exporter protein C
MNTRWESLLGIVGLLMLIGAHYVGLFVAPPEAMMGDVGRILYAHVPTAWIGLLTYLVAFIAGIGALLTGRASWDAMVEATVEVGLLLNVLLLIQGSLWAKPTWGVYWTWDPRLTTCAIMVVAFGVVLALRRQIEDPARRLTLSSVATIIAFINVPIVYMSVQWWRTLHQDFSSTDTVSSTMVTPLRIAAFGMLFLATSFVVRRWRVSLKQLNAEFEAPDLPQPSKPLTVED